MTATLFDFNGVLVDDEAVHLAAFRAVLAPLGVEVTDEAYTERYLGFDDVGAFRAMLEDHGRPADAESVMRLVLAKKPEYMRLVVGRLVVFPGARELLVRRAARGPVGIVSGALRDEIEHALQVMDARSAVGFVVAAEDTTACKPDPEGYRLGLAELARGGHGAADVTVIEDSVAGIVAAKAAGLRCVGVTHSYPAARLHEAGADAVVASLAELTDAILDG